MRKKQLIIFDFDGVFREISWKNLHYAYCMCIKTVNKNPDDYFVGVDGFREWYDVDWHKNEERIFGIPYVRRPEFDIAFHAHFDPQAKLFPWVPEVVSELSKKYLLAVLSSSNTDSVENELAELVGKFCEVVGADKVKKLKPNPEGIFHLLQKYRIPKKNALIIGDTPVDIRAGKAACIKTGAAVWDGGLSDEKTMSLLSPDYIFRKYNDLLLLL
jgi:phosphoglycolate phosphatase-like HAD superfamily hydrolase